MIKPPLPENFVNKWVIDGKEIVQIELNHIVNEGEDYFQCWNPTKIYYNDTPVSAMKCFSSEFDAKIALMEKLKLRIFNLLKNVQPDIDRLNELFPEVGFAVLYMENCDVDYANG